MAQLDYVHDRLVNMVCSIGLPAQLMVADSVSVTASKASGDRHVSIVRWSEPKHDAAGHLMVADGVVKYTKGYSAVVTVELLPRDEHE